MSLREPLVSIGLIAYNRGSIISGAIESLLNQSYKNIELIISDDASTDSTKKICEKYAKKDKRIKYYQQKKNLGLARNSNFVLEKAKGKYFMWASDDDLWHRDFIKILVSRLENNQRAALVVSNFYLFKGDFRQYANYPFKNFLSGMQLIITYLKQPSLLVWGIFRTKTLKGVGGFHTDNRPFFHKGSDYVTVFKVLLRGGLLYEKKVLFFKRDSGFALDRFAVLKNLDFSQDIIFRIKRYLLYPFIFVYDLFYLLKFTILSNYSFIKKLIFIIYIFFWFFNSVLNIFWECLRGGLNILKGVLITNFHKLGNTLRWLR